MHSAEAVNPVWIAPFAVLLGAIALMPLLNPHWWEKRLPFVAIPLGLLTACYYLFVRRDWHPVAHAMHEYGSFIALVGALFVVAGGIRIGVKGEATPAVNTLFLAAGAALANLVGTTGASMLLIRPWLRMNHYRVTAFHVVFFIFLVSNVGGMLTPIGDPPLFLGFLKGVPFFWIGRHAFGAWLFATGLLLAIFFAWDTVNFRRAPRKVRIMETKESKAWSVEGKANFAFLAAVIAAVFVSKPLFLREIAWVAIAFAAYRFTKPSVRERNNFSFAPIREVAFLFFGIFLTMPPALEWFEGNAASLGISSARDFFWATGTLSAILDNAPTYLNFLSVAFGLFVDPAHVSQIALALDHGPAALRLTAAPAEVIAAAAEIGRLHSGVPPQDVIKTVYLTVNRPEIVKAISLGAVFFGAMTYIGNGPNFLVKSIAEHEKVKTASFFGYLFKYALPVLLPVFALVSLIFLR